MAQSIIQATSIFAIESLTRTASPSIEETFHTLNLRNAKLYFYEQLKELHAERNGWPQEIYKKLTKRFLFNEYVIKDEFDVFVAFETMNNAASVCQTSKFKNRLIYLTKLYDDKLDPAEHKSLRDAINVMERGLLPIRPK